jgi:hypothetical protein
MFDAQEDSGNLSSLVGGTFDLRGLLDLAAKTAGTDAALADDAELLDAAVAIEEARSLLDVAQGHVLARIEADGISDRMHGHRTGTWLGHAATVSRTKCRAKVRLARRAVDWFDEFDEAVGESRVGFQHLEVLCSVANVRNREALADAQTELIELAQRFSFEHWASLVRRLAAEFDADGGYDPNEDVHANRLRLSANGDLTVEVTGRLVGDARVTVEQTLGSLADELFLRFSRDQQADPELQMPARATLMALALEEACRRAFATDLASSEQPRTEAVVVVEQNGSEGAVLRSPDGTRLPDGAASLLTGASITPLVVDGAGSPLRFGRTRRWATPSQKLALAVRDRGCVFPGCDMPPGHCDAHHEPGYQHGGSTDVDKMLLLCRHHHGVTHRSGWTLAPDPDRDQHWIWTTPTGLRVRSQRKPA